MYVSVRGSLCTFVGGERLTTVPRSKHDNRRRIPRQRHGKLPWQRPAVQFPTPTDDPFSCPIELEASDELRRPTTLHIFRSIIVDYAYTQ